MKKTLNIALILTCTATLVACSSSLSKNNKPKLDYQSENNKVLNLEVPPDLRDPRQGDLYTLPNGMSANPNALKQNADMQTSRVLAKVKNAHIERSGNQRWLVVQDQKAEQLWALLRAFWQENGFTIYSEEPQAGVMETEWAENRAKLPNQGLRKLFNKVGLGSVYTTSERDKFLIRMEANKQNGYDIFFTHKGLEEVYEGRNKDRTVWQPRANDPNLEAAFLSRFMQYLGVEETTTKQQVQNHNDLNQGTEFAKLEKDTVFVSGNAERNINRIGAALDRIGLTVQEFVAERGLFVVQPAPAESDVLREAAKNSKKSGFLGKLFGKKEVSNNNESKVEQAPQLFVAVEQLNDGQRLHLLQQSGQPYQGSDKAKLLANLYRELK